MQPLISIIIPVYKTEKYLVRCINSVLAQTYENLEIILVDDGSPDNSGKICDELSMLDKRLKVIHKENGGVSSARNVGLNVAKGDYVCFIDSDDIVPNDSIFHLVEGIHTNSCDYAAGVCGIEQNNKTKNHIKELTIIDLDKEPVLLLDYITTSGSYSPYAKIYKLDVIKAHNIYYDENLKCSEDALFIRQYLRYCKRISLVPYIVYWYNMGNNQSLSKKRYEEFCLYYVKKLSAIETLLNVLPLKENEKNNFIAQRIIHGFEISLRHYFWNWNQKKDRIEFIKLCLKTFKPWFELTVHSYSQVDLKWSVNYMRLIKNNDSDGIYRKYFVKYILQKTKNSLLKRIGI